MLSPAKPHTLMAVCMALRGQHCSLSRCWKKCYPQLTLPPASMSWCSSCGTPHAKTSSTHSAQVVRYFSRKHASQAWIKMPQYTTSARRVLSAQTPSHLSSVSYASAQSLTLKKEVSLDNIFSDTNRCQFVERMNKLRPVRTLKMMGEDKNRKISAVLVPLCVVDGEPSILFTLRSSSLRKHRGEVSFPGGNQDDTDRDHTHTALRETFEEIGLNPRYFEVWGTLIPSPTSKKTGRVAFPVVARYKPPLDLSSLTLNPDEVEEVFTVPIRQLCDHAQLSSTQFRTGPGYTLPVFLAGPHRIWGLTAIILHQTLTLIAPGIYTYKIRHNA